RLQYRGMRLPIGTDKQLRQGTLNRCYSAQGLRIPVVELVPDAPDVLPTFVANTVKECMLEVIGSVLRPAIAHVHQMSRLSPFVGSDFGNEGILPATPLAKDYPVVPA